MIERISRLWALALVACGSLAAATYDETAASGRFYSSITAYQDPELASIDRASARAVLASRWNIVDAQEGRIEINLDL